jgi:hypothetical protein
MADELLSEGFVLLSIVISGVISEVIFAGYLFAVSGHRTLFLCLP